jgi:hypothetical protein
MTRIMYFSLMGIKLLIYMNLRQFNRRFSWILFFQTIIKIMIVTFIKKN